MRYPVFLKDSLVFKTCLWIRVRNRPEINIAPKRKKINSSSENVRPKIYYKTDKTTENVARYVRRMDTYPVGV